MTISESQMPTLRELRNNMNTLREDVIYMQRHFADLKEDVRLMKYTLKDIQSTLEGMREEDRDDSDREFER